MRRDWRPIIRNIKLINRKNNIKTYLNINIINYINNMTYLELENQIIELTGIQLKNQLDDIINNLSKTQDIGKAIAELKQLHVKQVLKERNRANYLKRKLQKLTNKETNSIDVL